MTHDPREALEPCPFCGAKPDIDRNISDTGVYWVMCHQCCAEGPPVNPKPEAIKAWNTRALTASPGEQKPVAWRMRLVAGVSAPLGWEYLSNQPSKHPRYEVEPLYLSPPPAAGWDELLLWLVSEIEVVKRQQRAAFDMNQDAAGDRYHARHLALSDVEQKIESLYRESQAPSGVVKGPIFGGTALCGHHVMAAICEKCNRPDAGGGVRVKPLEWVERVGVTGTFDANTSIGHYIASITDDGRGHWFIVGLTTSNYTTANIEAVKAAAQADYERRILSALSTPPAAAESNASVEARLREAKIAELQKLGDVEAIKAVLIYPDDGPTPVPLEYILIRGFSAMDWAQPSSAAHEICEQIADLFSAGGDEAKKSEGGAKITHAEIIEMFGEVMPVEAVTILQSDITPNEARKRLRGITPSSPTAERREIVARVLDRWKRSKNLHESLAAQSIEKELLAALDGGAGA